MSAPEPEPEDVRRLSRDEADLNLIIFRDIGGNCRANWDLEPERAEGIYSLSQEIHILVFDLEFL